MVFWLLFTALTSGMNVDSLTASLRVETGMAYLDQGLPQRAYQEFQAALETSSAVHEAHLGLARVAVCNQAWGDAEEAYATYMDLRPGDYRAPLELAEMLHGLPGREHESLLNADAALALAPLNGRCWLAVADGEAALGNREEAIVWYTRTIVESQEYAPEARLRMGILLLDSGDLSGAAEILIPAGRAGEADAWKLLALIYLEQNDHLRASDSIRNYLLLEPGGSWADSASAILEELSFQSGAGTTER